jgi:site-specific recombinase XerD
MTVALTVEERVGLVPGDAGKDERHRLAMFERWVRERGRGWSEPDLAEYRDEMLGRGLAPSTVAAHLSTVRGRYRRLVKDRGVRDALYARARAMAPDGQPADWKAVVDEVLVRIENAIDPGQAPVRVKVSQDRADAGQVRLSRGQAEALLAAPDTSTLRGLRDAAAIGLMLCTGVREAELVGLDVPDLRQRLGGELALHVREGKGKKERLVPYGELGFCLVIVDRWLERAGIEEGPVFRGFYRGGRVRAGRLTPRAVHYLLGEYPVEVEGRAVAVRPHDCRRTYARRLWEEGVDPLVVQQNLGHARSETTLGYIGALDASKRRPPAIYSYDLSRLGRVQRRC